MHSIPIAEEDAPPALDEPAIDLSSDLRGRVVMGRYELAELFFHGELGSVYLGHDQHSGRPVEIKILAPAAATAGVVERFRERSRRMVGLANAGLAAVYAEGLTENGLPFVITEHREGRNLHHMHGDPRLAWPAPEAIVRQLAEALQTMHAVGVTHGAVSPGNIVWIEDGARAVQVQLVDREFRPSVAAPEAQLDPRIDLYALGAVLYELCTGHAPEPYAPAGMRDPDAQITVPAAFESVVLALVDPDPGNRPGSAMALLDLLDRAAASSGMDAGDLEFLAALEEPSGAPSRFQPVEPSRPLGAAASAKAADAVQAMQWPDSEPYPVAAQHPRPPSQPFPAAPQRPRPASQPFVAAPQIPRAASQPFPAAPQIPRSASQPFPAAPRLPGSDPAQSGHHAPIEPSQSGHHAPVESSQSGRHAPIAEPSQSGRHAPAESSQSGRHAPIAEPAPPPLGTMKLASRVPQPRNTLAELAELGERDVSAELGRAPPVVFKLDALDPHTSPVATPKNTPATPASPTDTPAATLTATPAAAADTTTPRTTAKSRPAAPPTTNSRPLIIGLVIAVVVIAIVLWRSCGSDAPAPEPARPEQVAPVVAPPTPEPTTPPAPNPLTPPTPVPPEPSATAGTPVAATAGTPEPATTAGTPEPATAGTPEPATTAGTPEPAATAGTPEPTGELPAGELPEQLSAQEFRRIMLRSNRTAQVRTCYRRHARPGEEEVTVVGTVNPAGKIQKLRMEPAILLTDCLRPIVQKIEFPLAQRQAQHEFIYRNLFPNE